MIARAFGDNFLRPGLCKGLWRPQRLLGRCFGLTLHSIFPELSNIKQASKQCKLGKDLVRLGHEGYNSPFWCDPLPTSNMWLGKKLLKMEQDGSCSWKKQNLPTQCFGLGSERKNSTGGSITSQEECERSCCDSNKGGRTNCKIYQFISSRGCFFGSDEDVWCDDKIQGAYDGGRKCIPGYCDGNEEKQLKAYANRIKVN
eukprot:gene27757-36576_t